MGTGRFDWCCRVGFSSKWPIYWDSITGRCECGLSAVSGQFNVRGSSVCREGGGGGESSRLRVFLYIKESINRPYTFALTMILVILIYSPDLGIDPSCSYE